MYEQRDEPIPEANAPEWLRVRKYEKDGERLTPAFRQMYFSERLPEEGTLEWQERHEEDLQKTPEQLESCLHTLDNDEWHEILCAYDEVMNEKDSEREMETHAPAMLPSFPCKSVPGPDNRTHEEELWQRVKRRQRTDHPDDPRFVRENTHEPVEGTFNAGRSQDHKDRRRHAVES